MRDKIRLENSLGKSKFDKLRRISIIKTVAEKMNLEEGDEVEFFEVSGEIIIQKKPKEEDVKKAREFLGDYKKISLEELNKRKFKAYAEATEEQYDIMTEIVGREFEIRNHPSKEEFKNILKSLNEYLSDCEENLDERYARLEKSREVRKSDEKK